MSLISADLRLIVARRAGDRCEYCLLPQECQVATFPVDHVTPKVLAGPTSADNLALSCPKCNALKWKWHECRDPVTDKTVPLFNPRVQIWGEHFHWSEAEPVYLVGHTPTGRGTIALLDLNGTQHLAVRRLLLTIGSHPPRQSY